MIQPADLIGVWRRTILQVDGQEPDRATRVTWVQGPGFFVDLRQPADLPDFSAATCLRDLDAGQRAHLARQLGFAGRLTVTDDIAEWHRDIDLHPDTGVPDRAWLQLDAGVLTEIGTEAAYVEQWSRQPEPHAGAPSWGVRLIEEATGRAGILVRAGETLALAVAPSDPAEPPADVVCEISLGRIDAGGWRIEASTLPFKVGHRFAVRITDGSTRIALDDIDPNGGAVTRRWTVAASDQTGSLSLDSGAVDPVATAAAPVRGFQTIPVIDIGELIAHGAQAAPETVARLAWAAREIGFFSVIGHGCPVGLRTRLIARAQEFFAQPTERKMEVFIGRSPNHRGYVPPGEEGFGAGPGDRKEAFDLSIDLAPDDPDVARYPLLGPNQWPDLPGFAADVTAYYDAVFGIGRKLMRGFALALGQPAGHFDPFITRPPSQLRLIHYAADPEARDGVGIGQHTDFECLTLLLATTPGLEVMNGDGQWIAASPVPGGLIVNIGDMLELLSDGAFVATTHRVRKVPAERYSFPLFFSLDYPTRVAPIRPGSQRSPMVAGEHLYAQTIHAFRYLRARLERGEIEMPEGAVPPASFGQEARQNAAAAT